MILNKEVNMIRRNTNQRQIVYDALKLLIYSAIIKAFFNPPKELTYIVKANNPIRKEK